MFYLGIIVVVGLIAYLTQNKRERKFPTWLKVLLVIVGLVVLADISEELMGIVFLALIVWWLVRRPSRQKRKEAKPLFQLLPFLFLLCLWQFLPL